MGSHKKGNEILGRSQNNARRRHWFRRVDQIKLGRGGEVPATKGKTHSKITPWRAGIWEDQPRSGPGTGLSL